MKNKKVYLFDFDGTLVDSMPTFTSIMLNILDDNGIEYGDDIMKIITPLGYLGTAEYYLTLGVPHSVDQLLEIMNRSAVPAYETSVPAKPAVIETLRTLKARGDDLNILTASAHNTLDPCLRRLGIWELFSNIWSCNDFDTTKADPNIYKMAAEKIGRSVQDIIFIDDNINAIKTAKSAGMIAYGIYDVSSADYVEEMKEISDRYLYTIDELL